jgi:hypothetical protein
VPWAELRTGLPAGLRAKNSRVVQKLKFLNNNRLKTAKNMDFIKKSMFFGRLES